MTSMIEDAQTRLSNELKAYAKLYVCKEWTDIVLRVLKNQEATGVEEPDFSGEYFLVGEVISKLFDYYDAALIVSPAHNRTQLAMDFIVDNVGMELEHFGLMLFPKGREFGMDQVQFLYLLRPGQTPKV